MTDLFVPTPPNPGGGIATGLTRATQLQQINLNTELILGANPWMAQDPASLQRLAMSGAAPEDLVNNAAAMAGVESIDTMARALSTLTPQAQRASYDRLTEQQQRALSQMGYAPSTADLEDNNFFGDTLGTVADVLSPVMRPLATAADYTVMPALDALAWVGDVPAHFYRSIRQMDGWQQWVALGVAAAATGVFAPGAIAALGITGTLGTIGTAGAIGLAGATAATAATSVTNLTEWWDVFNPIGSTGVGRGERIFDRGSQQRARDMLGGAEHLDAIARDIAANMDVYDLAKDFAGVRDATNQNVLLSSIERVAGSMADAGTPEFQRVYDGLLSLVQQPEFMGALEELQGGKISFGRDVAGAFGLEPGDSLYGKVSGGMDALWLVTMDPTMALGKVGVLTRMGRRGGRILDGSPAGVGRITDMLDTDPKVATMFDEVAAAIDADDFTRMPKEWASTYDDLIRHKRQVNPEQFTRQDIAEYLADQGGIAQIMAGKATVRGSDQVRLSVRSRNEGWGGFVESVRRFQRGMTDEVLEDAMRQEAKRRGVDPDLEALLPQNAMGAPAEDDFVRFGDLADFVAQSESYRAGQMAGRTMMIIPGGRSFANFIGSISTMTPASKSIMLAGDDALTDIPRFIESFGRHMNISGRVRDEWLREVMRQGTITQRRNVLKSFMDTGFTAAGMRSTDEMAQVVDELLTKYDAAYALGGLDDVRIDDYSATLGIYPDIHQAAQIIVPDLGELSQIIRKGHVLKHVAKVSDSTFVEQSMSRVVKPGWLLRIGFIPRAAGEEMLAFWARASETSIVAELGARSIGKGRLYEAAVAAKAAGDELTPEMVRALDRGYNIATHARPLVAMGRRFRWDPAEHVVLEGYTEWMRNAFERGMGFEFNDSLPQWAQNLAYGKEHSWRRVLLNGVDEHLVTAGREYATLHATPIMAAVSSNESSNFDTRLLKRNSATVHLPDPRRPGKLNEVKVQVNADGTVGTTDVAHRAGVHHRISEPYMDEIVGPALTDSLTNYLPESIDLTRAQAADIIDLIPATTSATSRQILQTMLRPDPDALLALADTLRDGGDRVLARAVRNYRRLDDPRLVDLVDEIRRVAPDDPGIQVIADEIQAGLPGLERLQQLNGDEFHWMSMQLHQHLTAPIDTTRMRRPDGWVNRPPVVYYRDPAAYGDFRINDDGTLTLLAGEPFSPGGPRSMRMATIGDRDTPLIEIDGTFIHGEYGTNLDALRAQARAGDETAAATLRGEGDRPFTEIEIVVDEGEITIPAGRWRYDDASDLDFASGWAPMYESFDDMREGLIEQLVRTFSEPDFDRSRFSDLVADAASGPIARAVPADVMRVYAPTTDSSVARVLGMLDQSVADIEPEALDALQDLAVAVRSVADSPAAVDDAAASLRRIVDATDPATSLGQSARRVSQAVEAGEMDVVDAAADLVEASKAPANVASIADELLSHAADNATGWNASVAELTDTERRSIIQVALEEISRNRTVQSQPTLTAIESLAFEDPNIATWVSSILSDAGTAPRRQAAVLDLPMNLVDDAPTGPPQGVESLTQTASGRVLRVDDRYAGTGDLVDTTRIESIERSMFDPFTGNTAPGLEWRVGESYETAMRAYAERVADHALASQRRLSVEGELVDDVMWGIVSPLVQDSAAERAGMAIAKNRNGQTQTITKARVTDVAREPSATQLANVDIVADEYRFDGLWDRIVRFGWGKVIGPAIDGLAREPMAFHYFQRSLATNRRNLHWLLDNETFTRTIPNVFPEVRALDEIGDIGHLSRDVRRLLKLDNVDDVGDDPARALVAHFGSQEDLDEGIVRMLEIADERNSTTLRRSAERLQEINYEASKFARSEPGVLGADSAAQRFIKRYDEALPDDAWQSPGTLRTALRGEHPTLGRTDLDDDQIAVLFDAHRQYRDAMNIASENAARSAIEQMIPFLDSHQQRSMFATYARNYIPFWYAEENFLKRWARTLQLSEVGGLDAVRRAQLTYMGLRSAGIVRTDANGEDWVVYPGSGLLTEAVAKLPGMGDTMPVGVMFQARTDSLLPGVGSQFGEISPSPYAALPVHVLSHFFPDMADAKRTLLGDIGASRNPLTQFVPSTVSRTFTALFQDENSSERYASAMMAAMAYMEAADQGLADNASPAQVDEYLDRLRNHARIVMLAQAIGGFVSPGSPQALITGQDATSIESLTGIGVDDPRSLVSAPYRELISNLGIERGTEEFLRLNPTADLEEIVNPLALVASQSESVSGAPLPATEIGMSWYMDNQAWVDSAPDAGAWFLPQDDADADFDFYSYSQQFASGLRKQRTPEEFLRSLKFRMGAEVYFAAADAKDESLERANASGNSTEATREVNAKWDRWKSRFLAANPIFAEELTSNDSRQRRARTIEQLRYASQDPNAPESPYSEAIAEITRAWDNFTAQRTMLTGKRDAQSREQLRQLKDAFANWATGWQLRHPEMSRLWTSVYQPEARLN